MSSVVEEAGNKHAGHVVPSFSLQHNATVGESHSGSPFWYSDTKKLECCSPPEEATTPTLKGTARREVKHKADAGSIEASSLPHWMDPMRVPGGTSEKSCKGEVTPAPGPSTPMQGTPSQQKLQPRETPEPCSNYSDTTSNLPGVRATKNLWSQQALSKTVQVSSVPVQELSQQQKENVLSLTAPNLRHSQLSQVGSQSVHKGGSSLSQSHPRIGHPPLNRALATLGTPKKPLLGDELQLQLHSKPTQQPISGSSELRPGSHPSPTPKTYHLGRDNRSTFLTLNQKCSGTGSEQPIAVPKPEPLENSVPLPLSIGPGQTVQDIGHLGHKKPEHESSDVHAGLTLGLQTVPEIRMWRSKLPTSQTWPDLHTPSFSSLAPGAKAERFNQTSGPSFAPKTPIEGIAFMQLLQGAAMDTEVEQPQNMGDVQIREAESRNLIVEQVGKRKQTCIPYKQRHPFGGSEGGLSQVQEHFLSLRAEHALNPFVDTCHERSKKRVKRRPINQTSIPGPVVMTVDRDQWSSQTVSQMDSGGTQFHRKHNFFPDKLSHEDSATSSPVGGSAMSLLQRKPKDLPGMLEPGDESAANGNNPASGTVIEKVLAKILDMPTSENKTVVVKKTPKRVHNRNPQSPPTRHEALLMADTEGRIGSPVKNHQKMSPKFSPPFTMPTAESSPIFARMMSCSLQGLSDVKAPGKPSPQTSRVEDEGDEIVQEERVRQPPTGSKLLGVPAYAPMPAAHLTFSAGEPSLPLSLNFSPKPPSPLGLSPKVSTGMFASPEEEWGKSLALSAIPAASPAEVDSNPGRHRLLNYQERFIQLQAFLKSCDESDQKDLLQALRSLSAAARSGHAVELETRAMWLSIEEGKEMSRVKTLNVMGRGMYPRLQNELGGETPQGVRLPAFSNQAELSQQTFRGSTAQMLMSASSPSSVHAAAPNFT